MGIISNNFIETLKNTDDLVSLENIAHLSKQLSKLIENIVYVCNTLFGKRYSLFLTGSLAICLRAGSLKEFRMSGDKSDLDLWIMVNDSPDKLLKQSLLEKEIVSGFSRLIYYNIVCIPPVDSSLKVSLKIMLGKTAKIVLRFDKIKLSVFRFSSLKKVKEKNTFYGIKRAHIIPVDEKKIKMGGFLWRWPTNPFLKKDFVLTDVHSCFLVGGFLTDGLNLKMARNLFFKKFFFHFKKYQEINNNNNQFKILRYFYNRFPLSAKKVFEK